MNSPLKRELENKYKNAKMGEPGWDVLMCLNHITTLEMESRYLEIFKNAFKILVDAGREVDQGNFITNKEYVRDIEHMIEMMD